MKYVLNNTAIGSGCSDVIKSCNGAYRVYLTPQQCMKSFLAYGTNSAHHWRELPSLDHDDSGN